MPDASRQPAPGGKIATSGPGPRSTQPAPSARPTLDAWTVTENRDGTACREWRGGNYTMGDRVLQNLNRTGLPTANGTEFLIRPSAIPGAALLWLGVSQTGKPNWRCGPARTPRLRLPDGQPGVCSVVRARPGRPSHAPD